MRHGRPQAHRRDARAAARVEEHADDAGRPLVARELQPELVDELRIGRRARDRRRPRVRHVGDERAERHGELDAELAREIGDDLAERPPAVVRLDADEEDRVAVGSRDARPEERVLRPLDLPRPPVLERDDAAASPGSRRRARDRCRRTSARPRAARGSPPRASLPGRRRSSRGRRRSGPAARASRAARRSAAREPSRQAYCRVSGRGRTPEHVRERDAERPDRRRERDVDEHEPPRQRVAVLHLAEDRLRDEHGEQPGPETDEPRVRGSRFASRSQPTTRTPIPKAAATRTCT